LGIVGREGGVDCISSDEGEAGEAGGEAEEGSACSSACRLIFLRFEAANKDNKNEKQPAKLEHKLGAYKESREEI
jgi:hypothetical protein